MHNITLVEKVLAKRNISYDYQVIQETEFIEIKLYGVPSEKQWNLVNEILNIMEIELSELEPHIIPVPTINSRPHSTSNIIASSDEVNKTIEHLEEKCKYSNMGPSSNKIDCHNQSYAKCFCQELELALAA